MAWSISFVAPENDGTAARTTTAYGLVIFLVAIEAMASSTCDYVL